MTFPDPAGAKGGTNTLGLVCAGFAFVGAVTLIFLLTRFGKWAAFWAVCAIVLLGIVIWLLADLTHQPFLNIVIPLCAVTVASPIILYRLLRSGPSIWPLRWPNWCRVIGATSLAFFRWVASRLRQ